MSEYTIKVINKCCFLVFFINILSDGCVYYYEWTSVPPKLTNWWLWVSVIGTIVSSILMVLDCRRSKKEWALTGHWAFLATVSKDLLLLILSPVTLFKISCDQLSKDVYVLYAFIFSSIISLVLSLLRFMKVRLVDYNPQKCCHCILIFLPYIAASGLSIVVILTVIVRKIWCYAITELH